MKYVQHTVLLIRDPRSSAFSTPGSGLGKKSRSGIRDERPGSYIRELRNNGMEKYGSGININTGSLLYLK
jgi:hypothetical protein